MFPCSGELIFEFTEENYYKTLNPPLNGEQNM